MVDKQTTFSPVDDLEETLVSNYLSVEDVKMGDKVQIIKSADKPILWQEEITMKKEGKESEVITVYKVMILKNKLELEMKVNGISRKTIHAKIGNDVSKLANLTATLAIGGTGSFSHFFIASLE